MTDQPAEAVASRARLSTLTIKNFRCIGSTPVVIALDDIVVLVGPNNVGKSTILRAYQLAMLEGSSEAKLKLDEFPDAHVDPERLPEIELETVVFGDNKPGQQWIRIDASTGEMLVREKWIWSSPDVAPKRYGFDNVSNDWSDSGVPWGAANFAQSNRPKPHRVDAFADPAAQAAQVVDLLNQVLKEQFNEFRATEPDGDGIATPYQRLVSEVVESQKRLLDASRPKIEEIEEKLSTQLQQVFPQYRVKFEPRSQEDVPLFVPNGAKLLVGPTDGHLSSVELQGSGARRTLLWTALRILAEGEEKPKLKKKSPKSKKSDESTGEEPAIPQIRPNLLLLDEPEICLHPNAIRNACKVLYDLPKNGRWQVMVTTHSPSFIDISRDNTTIVRVERATNGNVSATTVFRPQLAQLTEDERSLLKMMNAYDPHVAEFFFGGRNVIVEGDTEYTAFRHVVALRPDVFDDVHIIRARGKGTIVALAKILNQFGAHYSILHDSDKPKTRKDATNPAWSLNQPIFDSAAAFSSTGLPLPRVVASIPNFDEAFLGGAVTNEKPYNAISRLTSDDEIFEKVAELLAALLNSENPLPSGAIAWKDITELEASLNALV